MEESKIPQAGGDEKLCRACTDEGLELPVIDVTHAAFHLDLSEARLTAEMEKAVSTVRAHSSMPAQEQHAHMQGLLRGSFLASRIAAAQGGILGGMSTYFLKLGPDNLGDYAGPIDRAISGSMPSLSCRIRLQHMAQLIADMLEPILERSPGRAVRLVNVAGGPGMDTLNALIVLRKRRPDLLCDRRSSSRSWMSTSRVRGSAGGHSLPLKRRVLRLKASHSTSSTSPLTGADRPRSTGSSRDPLSPLRSWEHRQKEACSTMDRTRRLPPSSPPFTPARPRIRSSSARSAGATAAPES